MPKKVDMFLIQQSKFFLLYTHPHSHTAHLNMVATTPSWCIDKLSTRMWDALECNTIMSYGDKKGLIMVQVLEKL